MPSRQYAALRELGNHLHRFMRRVDKLIWPTRSLITGEQIAGPGLIEPEHWSKIRFLSGPKCCRCGMPFEVLHEVADAFLDEECPACIARKPGFDRARSVFAYDDLTSQIVLRFKNGADRTGLKLLARWCAEYGAELVEEADVIMAVPLHVRRLRARGYNQSLWLAAAISRETNIQLKHHILKRLKNTPSQAGKSANGRRKNVEGAFQIGEKHNPFLKGKRVLLVDDVYTTGATVEACSRVLKRHGAANVDIVTLSRVVSPVDPTI